MRGAIFSIGISIGILLGLTAAGEAQLQPPTELQVQDVDNDAGENLQLSWTLSADDAGELEANPVQGYRILRVVTPSKKPKTKFDNFRERLMEFFFPTELEKLPFNTLVEVATVNSGTTEFRDEQLEPEFQYTYRVLAFGQDAESAFAESETMTPVVQWIDKTRIVFGILMTVICGSVVMFVALAQQGRDLKIRKIAGLEAVEEAVGRATEMGREVLFIPGIQDINEIQTVAGLIILNRVAELTAEYDAALSVPTTRSLVMATARETVAAAYTTAGRPDLYNPDDIYYLTDEQFGFVAGVTGKMVRDKPAACFYMGAFYAESLIFAETAHTIGAIQVAGTAMPSQLPFFVAACDYVLIGEEFFAASAYLSGEPKQLGSLKGQDVGKLIAAILVGAGSLLLTTIAFLDQRGSDPELLESLRAAGIWIRDTLLKG